MGQLAQRTEVSTEVEVGVETRKSKEKKIGNPNLSSQSKEIKE